MIALDKNKLFKYLSLFVNVDQHSNDSSCDGEGKRPDERIVVRVELRGVASVDNEKICSALEIFHRISPK